MNKSIFYKWRNIFLDHIPFFVTLWTITLGLGYWILQNVSIGFLQLHSIDEYVFHGSLRYMLNSLLEGNLSGVFGYGFYQYGFIYFFLNLVAAGPFILTGSTDLAIIAPRVVTALFAVGSFVVLFVIFRLYLEKNNALLGSIILISFPAFWYNATWFHPDWSMTFWLLFAIYWLCRDNFQFGRCFWIGVLCYALAVSFKYQAITFLPLFGLYIFYPFFITTTVSHFLNAVRRSVFGIILTIVVFVLANPYVLHPLGWRVFTSSFIENMKSNATNHGTAGEVSIGMKIESAVTDYYMPLVLLCVLAVASLYALKNFRTFAVISCIAGAVIINFAYLLLFVNKSWQTYYLPIMTCALVFFIPLLKRTPRRFQTAAIFMTLTVQLISYGGTYATVLTQSRDHLAPDYSSYTEDENTLINETILAALNEHGTATSTILLSPYTPFDYEATGLTYEQVKLIFGPLQAASFSLPEYIEGQKRYWGTVKSDEELAASFVPIDFIVIRKNVPYLDTRLIAAMQDQEAYWSANRIMQGLYSGAYEYAPLLDTPYVVIFKRT